VYVADDLIRIDLTASRTVQVLNRSVGHIQTFELLLADRLGHGSHVALNILLGKRAHLIQVPSFRVPL
jgi:hypothetical protein